MAKKYDTESYRASGDFLDSVVEDIPDLLKYFLSDLVLRKKNDSDPSDFVKRDNIAHAIISSIRPKSFNSHLQLAVGTYIYKKTGSRLIIDLLSKLGVSASYYNIQLFEASTMIDPPKMIVDDVFAQYVFDNTDYNAQTLDGKRTFHCLGGIVAYTPEGNVTYEGFSKKCKKMPSAAELASSSAIITIPSRSSEATGLKTIIFEDPHSLIHQQSDPLPPQYVLYLWGKATFDIKIPSWRGFMETISQDLPHDNVSRIVCLPFINEPPSKHTSINTAIIHAMEDCQRRDQKTCIVTFDQPLFIKACEIVAGNDAMKNVVVRLGGFHTLMSYLGAIGYIMDGSGLQDMWSTVYADESVKNMMSGKAFSRALRAHILTYTAIGIHLTQFINDELSFGDRQECSSYLKNNLQRWDENPPRYNECCNDQVLLKMRLYFLRQLESLKSNGPTAKLFIQYFEMATIALQFIEAERLGDWRLHLQSVEKMIPYFHASGHYLYAKSAHIYLQSMVKLDMTMDDEEFRRFTEDGNFTIRRSYKAWSGIWSDMTIEQTLNRFFGTDLKHGRGVTPSVVARYLTCMPTSFAIMDSLEGYCGFCSSTSEQHVDLTNSRLKRDNKDLMLINSWLINHKPFEHRESLTSLSTGVVGGENINCHEALKLGNQSVALMIGKNAGNVSMSFRYKVKPISAAKSGIHVDKKYANVNSLLLFQRICVLIKDNEELTKKAFNYELSPFPLSLFDQEGFMRKNKKSELFTIFKTSLQSDALLATFSLVIDGGFLLHQINWPHGKTYNEIFRSYHRYIVVNFSEKAIVVFDGYNNEQFGVKSYERYRRKEKNVAADVDFEENMLLSLTQTQFLSNICNKQKFVELLGKYLKENGVTVIHADEDADLLIVDTAIELKKKTNKPVAVVGNDVDLLVLLIGLTPESENLYFYKVTTTKRSKSTLYCTSENHCFKTIIFFAHAFAGCDTTSAIFGKGKKSIIKLLEKNENLQTLSQVFYNADSSEDNLKDAAKKFIMQLYGIDNNNLSTGEMRYKRFIALATQSQTEIRLSSLPPTSSALLQHAKRVFYQIQKWSGNNLQPKRWGWKRVNLMMVPVMTTEDAAPKELLAKMYCGCSSNCANKRCGCRKAGLRCSNFCTNCNGTVCSNASEITTGPNLPDVEDQNAIPDTCGAEDIPDDVNENDGDNSEIISKQNEVNYESSDTGDDLVEREQFERRRKYVRIREILYNDDSDEEIENIDSTEIDFNVF